MNAERLLQFVQFLRQQESKSAIQNKLTELTTALTNLTNQPQQTQWQTQVATALDKLESSLHDFFDPLSPAQIRALEEINALAFFHPSLALGLREQITNNAMTPAVVRDHANRVNGQRASYLQSLQTTDQGLSQLGIKPLALTPGQAEIGFLIPRDLFKNELDLLVKELNVIRVIIGFFAEATTGQAQRIDVHQISSSDPTFFFGLDISTMVEIGGAITWLLHTWKQSLEIRSLHQQGKKLGLTDEELKPIHDKIAITVENAIDARLKELLPGKAQRDRLPELENDLRWALRSLFARIERGLAIEIRFIEPPKKPDESGHAAAARAKEFGKMQEISKGLEFPAPAKDAILELPGLEPKHRGEGRGPAKTK